MPRYKIDPQHSIVEFAVRDMNVVIVKGRFLGLEGWLEVDEVAPVKSRVEVRIKAANVDTGVPERDEHLRSADFFHVHLFPLIRFRSTRVEPTDVARHWRVHGDLSIRGTTREVILDTTLEGRLVDVDFKERIGFSAEAVLNRRDFGINWNGRMGRLVVGDEVKVAINVEAERTSAD